MADGTKLQPIVIFRRQTKSKGEKLPSGVLVHCHNKNGWMDEDGISLWLEKVETQRPGALLKNINVNVGSISSPFNRTSKEAAG